MMTSINGQVDAISAEDHCVTWGKPSLNVGVCVQEFLCGVALALQEYEEEDEFMKLEFEVWDAYMNQA